MNRIDSTGKAWWHVAVACLAVAAVCAVAVAAAPVLAAAAVGAGIATTASAIATAAFATGTVATVIGVSACGTGIAKTISKSKSSYKSTAKSKAKEKDITAPPPSPTVIYRYGGTNPGNLTPRQKDKYTGLSFLTKPMPGAAMTTLEELNSTGVVYAVRDGATHVSVRPIGGTMDDWINAGSNSIWTQAVKSVVVKWDGDN